ncbi:MAG: class I SAM-dependent methyltransferase [Candidatus Bathyarchaeia archaeon]
MASEGQDLNHWDAVALEAEKEHLPVVKWRVAARNWLAHYVENKARDFILSVVESHVKLGRNAQILDVGCGIGKWVKIFAERGFTVTGIDASPWMIRVAKSRVGKSFGDRVRLAVMDASKLDLPNDFYDLVSCVTVLQHVFDDAKWKKAISEMIRVAKPSSSILIYEAAPTFILKKCTAHVRFRSMKEYVREFEKFGARLTYWRATDLSFPVTFIGLRTYASSFSQKVYYYLSDKPFSISPHLLSLFSRVAATIAKPVDYKFSETPLGLLSAGKILLFKKCER